MKVRDLKRFLDELVIENYDSLDWEVVYADSEARSNGLYAQNVVTFPSEKEIYIN